MPREKGLNVEQKIMEKVMGLIWIHQPDVIHNAFGVEYLGKDKETFISLFREKESELGIKGFFLQGNHMNWAFFEYWGKNGDEISLNMGLYIAEKMGIDLKLEDPSREEVIKEEKQAKD